MTVRSILHLGSLLGGIHIFISYHTEYCTIHNVNFYNETFQKMRLEDIIVMTHYREHWNNLSVDDKLDHEQHEKNRTFGQLG